MRFTVTRGVTALALLAAVWAIPASAAAGNSATSAKCTTSKTKHHTLKAATASPAITLGIFGGNVVPWSVSVAGDGTITSAGWNKPNTTHLTDGKDALPALFKLADTEGFWSMPAQTRCTGTLPDIVNQYIQIYSSTGSKRVAVHGGCNANFQQLLAAFENAVGLTK
jgi:hypothetical protein